ncbi:SH3 domain-containing protein, partial [Colletotrichum tanaceti]
LSSLRPRPPDPDATPVIKPPGRGFGAHVHKITTTAGIPFNKAAHLVGAEGWFPQTMPRECAKAARILRSFTGQPLGATEPAPSHVRGEPYHPLGVTRRSIVTIPYQVFAHCAGLAIFNTLRAGAYMGSLAAGSGLVVARRPDDTWSPPSSFVVSTLGAGFMFGLDIYECVLVLNTPAQVAAFTHPRLSLGAETSVAIGPVGTGGAVEAAVSRTSRSMYSYMKSRGLWAGIQVDGTIILARQDCNSVAYNERGISARRILQTHTEWPEGSMPLWQTLIALEGQYAMDWDMARELAMTGTPGDFTPPMEEDEEEEPAPAYTSRPAPQFRSTHGVMNANQNGVEPSPEQKEMMLRRGA